jgi:peptidyl-prolyl cis-trans isomerase B (cyclophilin B)
MVRDVRKLTMLLLVLAAFAAGCGGDDGGGGGGTTAAATDAPVETGSTETAPDTVDTSGDEEAGGCETVAAPEPRPSGTGKAPTALLNEDETYDVVVATNCGDFTIRLDPKASPKTAASFAALVEAKFFDGTVFHRIVPNFVIQGGDPTATGTGGPGYSTVDTPAPRTLYTQGVVAMAKAGAEPPGTAGSQFFVVTTADAGLPPDYAVVGKVTDGLEVVERIGLLGGADEVPTQPVVVETMTLRTS